MTLKSSRNGAKGEGREFESKDQDRDRLISKKTKKKMKWRRKKRRRNKKRKKRKCAGNKQAVEKHIETHCRPEKK